jgi:hypothetical protein
MVQKGESYGEQREEKKMKYGVKVLIESRKSWRYL